LPPKAAAGLAEAAGIDLSSPAGAMLENGARQQAILPAAAAAAEVPGRRRHYAAPAESGGGGGEAIPLCELRPTAESADASTTAARLAGGTDALKQLHAQSSAETSGVGDSLQRIHAVSLSLSGSTQLCIPPRTLGLVPAGVKAGMSPCRVSLCDPVWYASSRLLTYLLGDSFQRIHALSSTETSGYDPVHSPTDLASVTSPSERPRAPAATAVRSALPEYQSTAMPMSGSGYRQSGGSPAIQRYAHNGVASPVPPLSAHQRHSSPLYGRRGYRQDDEADFDVDDDERSSPPRGRYRRRSHAEEAGSPSDDGHFLGRNTQSAWLRWSHERRESYRRKVEYMEKRQSDMERFRVSSPVRKARQESARLLRDVLGR